MPVIGAFMVPHPPMIIPQVGRGSEKQIRDTILAYEKTAEDIAALKPDTIIISSPHSVMYSDYFHISPGSGASGSFAIFGAPGTAFKEEYDTELVQLICDLAQEAKIPAGTMGERDKSLDHGTMVPLYFIRHKYNDFKMIRTGLSGLALTEHYRFGRVIRDAVQKSGRRVVFVASGDLSHKLQKYGPYGFAAEGPEYDKRVMDVCERAAFGELLEFDETFCEKAAECGHRSFVIMAGVLDGEAVEAHRLSHEDVTGVGYGICEFYPKGADESRHFLDIYLRKAEKELAAQREKEDPYVRLARASVESFVTKRKRLDIPDWVPVEMKENRAGTFVSIHEYGKLRGCIGTIMPTSESIAREIIENAISASTRDPRFEPIRPEELAWLQINVDVLGSPEKILSKDQLDVKRYGVIVTKGRKRGLLLPDLDGVDTVEQQISIARQKAGIGPHETVELERFEVVRHY